MAYVQGIWLRQCRWEARSGVQQRITVDSYQGMAELAVILLDNRCLHEPVNANDRRSPGFVRQFMIDPPWPKKKGGMRSVRPHQGRDLDYRTLSVPAIFSLLDQDIFSVAAESHNVFLWCVDEFLTEAEAEMFDRGYRRHARIIWDKGNGVAPAFSVRFSHEYLVWFYRGKFIPVAAGQRGKFTTVIREGAREHSRKPEAAYQMVEVLYPDEVVYYDVFSRQQRELWTAYGNEVGKFS